jgi:hypothetical protein
MARCWASIARCTSPTIRSITRSTTSPPATWAFAASTRASRAWRRWSAGTSGIPRRRAWRRWPARRCCSIPRPSAGIPPRRRATARRSTMPGAPSSAPTPSPTASTWPRSTAWATKGRPRPGLEFWGGSFVADPFGQVLAEASHDREETLIVECDPRRIEEVRRNWPFLRDRRIDAYEFTSKFPIGIRIRPASSSDRRKERPSRGGMPQIEEGELAVRSSRQERAQERRVVQG